MLYDINQIDVYNSNIIKAVEYLKIRDFDNAKVFIHSIMSQGYDCAKAHNLLAIYYELTGDLNLAKKHYRASLALDPTLKSADNNLKRICLSRYICNEEYVDYGEYINKSVSNI